MDANPATGGHTRATAPEYHEFGIDEFVLSGHAHLEEAYQVGAGALPLL
jgi:alkanesulfonate monooxygenase